MIYICKKGGDMPTIFRRNELSFTMRESPMEAYRWMTTPRLGKTANSKSLNFDIRILGPGKFSFPYHAHRASEELFMIISGEATLRTPEGFRLLTKGDMVFFEEGASSAHQLYNHSEEDCEYLDIRAAHGIDIVDYPDTGKMAILPSFEVFDQQAKTDYFRGEENVADRWPESILKRKK